MVYNIYKEGARRRGLWAGIGLFCNLPLLDNACRDGYNIIGGAMRCTLKIKKKFGGHAMLEYTRASINKTVDDCKLFAYIYGIISQALCVAYLIYAMAVSAGMLWANIVLCAAASAYLAFNIITHDRTSQRASKVKKVTKRAYKWLKICIRAVTLGFMVYNVYVATTHITPLSVIWAGCLVIGWILQIIIELTVCFIENRARLIMDGIEADVRGLLKPVHTVGNILKKVTGAETEPEPEPSKNMLLLDKRVRQEREQKLAKKAALRTEKIEKRALARAIRHSKVEDAREEK